MRFQNNCGWRKTARGTILLVLAFAVLFGCGSKNQEQGAEAPVEEDKPMQWSAPPEMAIDPGKRYTALFKTSKGEFTIELFADTAPITVNNFIFLARQGFYDGVIFHRIIETFMIQTGDPLGNGTGGPGYRIADELDTPHHYEPGIVAMANAGPNTGGSQFFICTGMDSVLLNDYPDYTIFGRVTKGMETVLEIAKTPVVSNERGELSVPTEKVTIDAIEIRET